MAAEQRRPRLLNPDRLLDILFSRAPTAQAAESSPPLHGVTPAQLRQAQEHAKRSGLTYPSAALRLPSSIAMQQSVTAEQRAELVDCIRGCLFGQAIGDAVGLPTEFRPKAQCESIHPTGRVSMQACRHWVAGDWTDDTDQMILILDSLLAHSGAVDGKDFAVRLQYWCWNGFTELGDCGGSGIGQTVGQVVESSGFTDDPWRCAAEVYERSGRQAAANGAVMRTSVLGVAAFESLETVIHNTLAIARTTHADARCLASSLMCSLSIALTLQNCLLPATSRLTPSAILDRALDLAVQHSLAEQPEWATALREHCTAEGLAELQLSEGRAIGYTYKCIGAGVWAYRGNGGGDGEFRERLSAVVMEGGDADTNGAVAGAMLGCRLGWNKLDDEWKAALVHKQWLNSKVDGLLALMVLKEGVAA